MKDGDSGPREDDQGRPGHTSLGGPQKRTCRPIFVTSTNAIVGGEEKREAPRKAHKEGTVKETEKYLDRWEQSQWCYLDGISNCKSTRQTFIDEGD